ncbi:MAG: MBL fold metallo-hydrolase [Planctomycetes bacterium]|nr:MBL fold metallo-hydrolase [Planctomycetota bacterium]
MEVFFLDVGQGTCQIILLGGRRAIVLDCGVPNDRLVLQFLRRLGIEYLDRLIISHSHSDHIGGAVSVLGEYQDRIEKICFVQDDQFLASSFWRRISELVRAGTLTKQHLIRLEATTEPQLIWSDEPRSARLRTYSPTAAENLLAQDAGQQNPTSAVLFFDVRDQRIIFAADSEVSQWQEIRAQSGRRMACRVLAVPHHAGRAHSSPQDLEWLFGEALAAEVAVISVGTSNTHGHPRQDVIKALTARGAKIMCTQITRRCNNSLETLRPAVLRPVLHQGRSSSVRDVTRAGNSRNVACAGTVHVLVSPTGMEIQQLAAHQQAVDKLAASSAPICPLCRLS